MPESSPIGCLPGRLWLLRLGKSTASVPSRGAMHGRRLVVRAMAKPKELRTDREIASASGFPLQRHVAELIRKSKHWTLEAEEIRAGDNGFVDMILLQSGPYPTRVAIEVKRYVVDDRPGRLVFLSAPSALARPVNASPVLPYVDIDHAAILGDSAPHHLFACGFPDAVLACHVAEHCLFEDRGRENALFDDIARKLLEQMEALSCEAVGTGAYGFVPMIVTNADLRWLQIADVDPTLGRLPDGESEVVKWVRYEKTLSATPDRILAPQATNYGEWAARHLRTVFVVQVAHLLEFLDGFALAAPRPE